MSPKPRKKENKPYPKRWRLKHGAYFYRVPPGLEHLWDGKKEFLLGHTEAEAYKAWSERLELRKTARTMGDLLERYLIEVVPAKAHKSQESNRISIRRLTAVFRDVEITEANAPRHAYAYMDVVEKKHGKASANRDYEVYSHALSKAVEWGIIDRNNLKGQVSKKRVPRRERYVEGWELDEALKAATPALRAYVTLKLLTGLRRGDLLRLSMRDITDDGIAVQPSKTAHSSGLKLVIEWTDELREAVEAAKKARPKHIAPWLFCTRDGEPYAKEDGTANAFDSLWQRFMARALKETGLKERFQEKDLRKKTASDMDLERARALLGHTSAETTKRHYRIKGERVKPHTLKR